MKANLYIIILVITLSSFVGCSNYDLKEMFKESKSAFESNDVKKNDAILRKFFFTRNQDKSIWYHALKEWKALYGESLTGIDLNTLQKHIERVYRTYETCWNMPDGKPKAICFHRFYEILKGGNRDLSWTAAQGMTEEEARGKYGIFFTVHTAMTVHITLISLYNAQFYGLDTAAKKFMDDFIGLNEKNGNMLHGYEYELEKLRTDKVTPVKICQVKYHFWQKVEDVCETRWRRSIEEVDDEKFRLSNVDKRTKKNENVDFNIELNEDEPELEIANHLGDPIKLGYTRFHASVTDIVNGKIIYEKYADVKSEKKGSKMISLFKEGIEQRSNYVTKLQEKLNEFDNATVVQVRKMNAFLCKHLEFQK